MSKNSRKNAAAKAALVEASASVEPTTVVLADATEKPANKGVAQKRWKAGSVLGDNTLFGKTAKTLYPADSTITVLTVNNPKRAGSTAARRFAKYRDGMTIAEYCKAIDSDSVGYADIAWDVNHGFISVALAAQESGIDENTKQPAEFEQEEIAA